MRREGSQASQVAQRVMRARRRFFRVYDFEGLSPAAVDRELCRLAAAGELRRIRNGLYWRGPKAMLGIAPPPLDVFLDELFGDIPYVPAGVSAANTLGLTSQVAVNGRSPRDLPAIHFVQRAGRSGRQSARLRPHEVGFLEVLADFHEVVDDPSTALKRMRDLLNEGAVRRDALLAADRTEPPRVRRALSSLAAGDLEAARSALALSARAASGAGSLRRGGRSSGLQPEGYAGAGGGGLPAEPGLTSARRH